MHFACFGLGRCLDIEVIRRARRGMSKMGMTSCPTDREALLRPVVVRSLHMHQDGPLEEEF